MKLNEDEINGIKMLDVTTVKGLLLSGVKITVKYKEETKCYWGDASLYVFSGGYGYNPKVLVSVPTQDIDKYPKDYPIQEIDDAIGTFFMLVYRHKNIGYKWDEAFRICQQNNPNINLDVHKHLDTLMNIREQLIREELKTT